jgi:DNA-binding transcriptional LysR family regulator
VLAVSRRQTFVLVVPSGHPLAALDVVDRAKLAGERLVAIRAGEGLRQLLDRVFRELEVDPDVSIETSDREMLMPLVAAGMGVTLVPDHFARRRLVEGVDARPLRPAVHRRVGAIVARGEASRQARDLVARLADEWPRE